MMEKLKTVALTLLVLVSLFQSYLLSYSYPQPEQPVMEAEYVKTEMLGSQASLDDMLFPDQLIVHLGNQQHTVLYPLDRQYTEIMNTVKQRNMEGLRKSPATMLGINWEEVRTKRPGLEVRFRDGLPLGVLQRMIQLKGDIPIDNEVITRIWIFAQTDNEVRTILFTDTANVVYEVTKADYTTKDIEERFVGAVGAYIPYKLFQTDMYIPTKPFPMNAFTMGYSQLTADQLKRTFFVDPALTRNLMERDGSEIYTDSKRGLQLKNDQHWMTYSDPVAPATDNRIDYVGGLLTAVQFINQHGGWNGTYGVQRVPERFLPGSQAYVFRQYYGSFPIINPRNENIGFMKVTLQKDIVSGYERSTVSLESRDLVRRDASLAGGEALDALLEQYPKRSQIVSLFPAYRPVITEKAFDLVPMWAVELYNGEYEFLG
ncbi:Two-component signal transduction system YycFG, regulatory protein YycH [Paenibacillus sp. UNCCL117]|uniref:YycH family regulatory protein n=1 Tax=unclassified Paenibacillus TaxID=185978 RepID=UPI00088CABE4|nr:MULTISPECIES: two-component system activity regulator YycH [unclassified Paenibacillus]SDD85843.1 Two-component signal transduction system YycFG, regulatory protein YycH [Paenibacillus sp. cl123]SFW54286.1 Two-component signal transduction system YycFG, regulatory protein YycH [Paenibacillus sp. UNCCL117]